MKKLVALTLVGCAVVGGTFSFRPRSIDTASFRPRAIEHNVEVVNETQEAGIRMYRH